MAFRYERVRQGQKWRAEHSAVAELLRDYRGSSVLDIPCGTGRFSEIYSQLGITATGMDISADMRMLSEARGVRAILGDIRSIPVPDKSYDVVVCVRLLNWLTDADLQLAWSEMRRVARKCIVFGFRGDVQADRAIMIDSRGYRIATVENL